MEQRPDTPSLRLAGTEPQRGGLISANASGSTTEEDLAKLTHELANLLDGSQRRLNLALRHLVEDHGGGDREEVLRQLRVLHTALDRMNRVVGAFRGRRLGRTLPEADTSGESLAAVLQHAVEVIEPAAAERSVTVELDLAHDIVELPAGPIYPVISNALRNALEACPVGGQISLVAEVVGEQIVIAVHDNGGGVDPDILERVFEFGASTKERGSGVGLALSREIVEQAGGVITLVNNPQGGATLRVALPKSQ
ncbi:MAG: sensor histidine kinase [Phycisphaerales bacterium JB038]